MSNNVFVIIKIGSDSQLLIESSLYRKFEESFGNIHVFVQVRKRDLREKKKKKKKNQALSSVLLVTNKQDNLWFNHPELREMTRCMRIFCAKGGACMAQVTVIEPLNKAPKV